MTATLPLGTRLHERYVVQKIISDHGTHRWYVAIDTAASDGEVMIRELTFDSEALVQFQHRRAEYEELLASIKEFEHLHLARLLDHFGEEDREYVVLEYVEGVTLKVMKEMMIGELPEKQIITWGLQISQALDYLHCRPRPYIIDRLDLSHLMLTRGESIMVIDYGLRRYTETGPFQSVFADSPEERASGYARLGRLLRDLMLGGQVVDFERDALMVFSHDLVKIVNQLLNHQADPVFESFFQVTEALTKLSELNPVHVLNEAAQVALSSHQEKESAPPPASDLPSRLVTTVARLPRWTVAVGVGVLILGLLIIFILATQGDNYRKNGPVAYVVSGSGDLQALDADDLRVRDHRFLKDVKITASTTTHDGSSLMLLDGSNGRILVLDPATDQVKIQVNVHQQPQAMFMDRSGQTLYCIHAQLPTVSVVNMNLLQMTKLLAVPYVPTSLAVSPDGTTLYASAERQNKVYCIDVGSGRLLSQVDVDGGPSLLLATADGQELWVVDRLSESITVLDVSGPPGTAPVLKHSITSLRGHGPVAMQVSQDGVSIYVLCHDSASITVLKPTDYTVTGSIKIGDPPTAWTFPANSNEVWVVSASADSLSLVDFSTQSVVRTVKVGKNPSVVEFVP